MRNITRERLRSLWPLLTLCLGLAVFQLGWQSLDTQIPDGDEAGHLGAIYLHLSLLPEYGAFRVVEEAFVGPGDYPPLFALFHALLLEVIPGRGPFPAGMGWTLTLVSLLTLWSTARLTVALEPARPQTPVTPEGGEERVSVSGLGWLRRRWDFLAPGMQGTGTLAAAFLCCSPLWMALSRQAMPEPFLGLWITLAIERQLSARDMLKRWMCVQSGLALGAALLTKQTAVLYLMLPLLVLWGQAAARVGWRVVPGMVLQLGMALPVPLGWLWGHREAQLAYGLRSAEGKLETSLWDQLGYYPQALAAEGLGAVLLLLVLWGVIGSGLSLWTASKTGARAGHSQRVGRRLSLGALGSRAWLLPVLLMLPLLATPKKYPRLWVPALPAVMATLALGVRRVAQKTMAEGRSGYVSEGVVGALALGGVQALALSFPVPILPERLGVWEPAVYARVDPDCPQRWIRRASGDDLGFEAIVSVWRKYHLGTQIALVQEPSIPCAYETTFGYAVHLSDYTRRRGIELDDVAVAELNPEGFQKIAPRARVILATSPWCVPEGSPFMPETCAFRGDFALEAAVPAKSERLSFTLYIYRRIRAEHTGTDTPGAPPIP